LPTEGQVETFQLINMNYNKKTVEIEYEQQYKAVTKVGFVGNVQSSANNRFIYIQLILPNKVKPGNNFKNNS
jgi:hypothetical protein